MQAEEVRQAAWNWMRSRLGSAADGHDCDHTIRVVRHALELCRELPEADVFTVEIAAVLHDIARPEESAGRGVPDHAEAGAVLAEAFLLERGVAPEQARRIAACIREHRYRSDRRPTSPEAAILFDADKLDSLGATGIGRAFLFAGKTGARLHNRKEEALSGAPYGPEDTAYREYLVKLRKLPEIMRTEPGRRRAGCLKCFMDDFFRQLNREIYPEEVAKC